MDLNNFRILSEYTFIKNKPNRARNGFMDDSLLEDDDAISLDDFDDADSEAPSENEVSGDEFADDSADEQAADEQIEDADDDFNDASEVENEVDMGDDINTGDEVEVDVTDIVTKVDDAKKTSDLALNKIDTLINSVNQIIDANNHNAELIQSFSGKIDSLNQEFVKRNPTPMEKLELRVTQSAPYNIGGITNYWDQFSKQDDNYVISGVEDPKKTDSLELNADEVNDTYNPNEIENSFDVIEDEDDM